MLIAGCEDTVEKTTQIFSPGRLTPETAQSQPMGHLVAAGEMLGYYHDLADAGGFPALVYQSGEGLRYAVTAEARPEEAGDWASQVIDPDPRSGISVRLMFCENGPVLVYRSGDRETTEQKFAAATVENPQSAEDWAIGEFAEPMGLRDPDSACAIAGKPAFVTTNTATGQLLFVTSGKAAPTGSGDWRATPVTVGAVLKESPRLCEIDGLPAVAYITADRTQVVVARAGRVNPAAPEHWEAETAAETTALEACCFTFTVVGGNLALIHCLDDPDTMAYTSLIEDEATGRYWRTDKFAEWKCHGYGLDMVCDGELPVVAKSLKSRVVLLSPGTRGLNSTSNWVQRKASPNGRMDARNCRAVFIDGHTAVSYFKFKPDEGLYYSVVY